MKNIILIISILFCFTSLAIAGESEGLSQQDMESVQQQTREMSSLGIPEAQAQKMLTQMVQNRFEKQNRIRAQQVVMATAKEGLPTEPVMSKAMEGMAKQAKEQQVIAAMETVRSRFAHAHRLAKSLSDDDESIDTLTRAIADSLAAGMKTQQMEAVQTQLRARTQNKAVSTELAIQTMQTVRTMVRLGVPPSEVSETLCQAVQNQYTHQEMERLRHQIAKQTNAQAPQQIARQFAGSIGKVGNAGNSGAGGSGSGAGAGGSGSGAGGSGSGSGGSGSGAGGSGSGAGGSGSGSN